MTNTITLKHIRRATAPAAAVAAVLLIAGCGSGGDSAAPKAGAAPTTAAAGVVLDVEGGEFAFTPSALKASAGETTIRFVNKGAVEHDYTIEALKIHIVALPGKTAEAKVTLKPGTYKSICAVPGHLQSGMKGTLTVS